MVVLVIWLFAVLTFSVAAARLQRTQPEADCDQVARSGGGLVLCLDGR